MPKRRKYFWFWAWILLGTVAKGQQRNPKARSEVWENLVLVKAENPMEAFEKAERVGRLETGDSKGTLTLWGRPAVTRFLGLSSIGLVHDAITDGVEITWRLKRSSWGKVKLLARKRSVLLKKLEREFGWSKS